MMRWTFAWLAAGATLCAATEPLRGDEPATAEEAAEEQVYDSEANAEEQIAAALAKAQARDKRVLLVFGGNWCGWCIKLHKVFDEDEEIASLLRAEYETVWIDIAQFDHHPDLAERYLELTNRHGVPFLAVLDANGEALTTQETGALEEGPRHDPAKVLAFLRQWRIPPRDAEELLAASIVRAGEQDKATLVCLSAPWCGWCHVLADFLDEHAELFDAHYVRLKIDLDRMDNAAAVAARLRDESSGGIPWFAVLDAQGRPAITSDGPEGNIGYPAREHEIAHFLTMLERSAPRMTAAERATIREALEAAAKERGF